MGSYFKLQYYQINITARWKIQLLFQKHTLIGKEILASFIFLKSLSRDHSQISLLILSEFKQINETSIPPEIIRKPEAFW